MIYLLYLPYHKSEFLETTDEGYKDIPEYPKEFRKVRKYAEKSIAYTAYANTPCPASQLIEVEKEEDVDKKIDEMDRNFANEEWLKKNIYPYV